MKKIAFLTALLALLSAPVLAAELAPDSTKASTGAVLDVTDSIANVTNFVKFSKSVYAGAQTSITGYALTTAHTSGTKYYGTGYDATAIYSLDAGTTVGSTLEAPSSSVTAEAFPADTWTKL